MEMFAGQRTGNLVFDHMNGIGNVMNLQTDAHTWYDNLRWGIEAREECQTIRHASSYTWCTLTRFIKVKYIYTRVPYSSDPGPAGIALRDGDEICGEQGERLGGGPLPLLCDVQLAVARVLHTSGAILDAKLLLKSVHV
jgi:hypothetical protein